MTIEDYNSIIRKSAIQNDCRLIDLFSFDLSYDSIDGLHPTKKGMQTLASMVCRSMRKDADVFLNCAGNEIQRDDQRSH